MKKIFLYAYDRKNLGDDLFVHTVANRYSGAKLYLWTSKENKKTFASLKNLKVIDQNSRLVRFLNRLRPSLTARYRAFIENRCDAVVYIGGSIFMEYDNWRQLSTWWEYEAENRAFYVLGANFGPYKIPEYREKMNEIFAKMQDVCFRDDYSFGLFKGNERVRKAPDILFSYPIPSVQPDEKQIFVSVIDCASRDESHNLFEHDEKYIAQLSAILRGYRNDGYSLVLASFCREEGDEKAVDKILEAMGDSAKTGVKTLFYDGTNHTALINAIAQSGVVIATRFHAAILGLSAQKKVLPIIYSDKTKNVLDDIEFEGLALDIRKNENCDYEAVSKAVAEYNYILPDGIKASAEKHFEKLDKALL